MSSDSIDPRWRRVAEEAARAAGRVAVAARGRVTVSSKGLRDVVTEADYAAQAAVKGIIGAAFPDHAFLAEEKDATPGGASDLTWVIDPIDGTTNYSHGVPLFCTSIALTRGGESLVGVVYDPLRDEMYAAVKGQGATLNGVSIQVSGRDRLIDAIVGIEWASPQDLRVAGRGGAVPGLRGAGLFRPLLQCPLATVGYGGGSVDDSGGGGTGDGAARRAVASRQRRHPG